VLAPRKNETLDVVTSKKFGCIQIRVPVAVNLMMTGIPRALRVVCTLWFHH